MKVSEILNEEIDLSMNDSLEMMTKYRKELQAELADEKNNGDKELIDRIEQDIFDVTDMIERKRKTLKK